MDGAVFRMNKGILWKNSLFTKKALPGWREYLASATFLALGPKVVSLREIVLLTKVRKDQKRACLKIFINQLGRPFAEVRLQWGLHFHSGVVVKKFFFKRFKKNRLTVER